MAEGKEWWAKTGKGLKVGGSLEGCLAIGCLITQCLVGNAGCLCCLQLRKLLTCKSY